MVDAVGHVSRLHGAAADVVGCAGGKPGKTLDDVGQDFWEPPGAADVVVRVFGERGRTVDVRQTVHKSHFPTANGARWGAAT
jgi:hypothetical protein